MRKDARRATAGDGSCGARSRARFRGYGRAATRPRRGREVATRAVARGRGRRRGRARGFTRHQGRARVRKVVIFTTGRINWLNLLEWSIKRVVCGKRQQTSTSFLYSGALEPGRRARRSGARATGPVRFRGYGREKRRARRHASRAPTDASRTVERSRAVRRRATRARRDARARYRRARVDGSRAPSTSTRARVDDARAARRRRRRRDP